MYYFSFYLTSRLEFAHVLNVYPKTGCLSLTALYTYILYRLGNGVSILGSLEYLSTQIRSNLVLVSTAGMDLVQAGLDDYQKSVSAYM